MTGETGTVAQSVVTLGVRPFRAVTRRCIVHTPKLALLAALVIAGGATATFTPPASAQVSLSFSVGTPPPPPRYEVVPAPRPGYVWAPGYWNWNGGRYVWVVGSWHRNRPGYVYYRPHWVHHGDRWQMERAHWDHDPHSNGRHDNGRHNGWDNHHHGDNDHHHFVIPAQAGTWCLCICSLRESRWVTRRILRLTLRAIGCADVRYGIL